MKKISVIILSFICGISINAQIPQNYADSLQTIIDEFQGSNNIPGILASVYIKDVGIWQGALGESSPGLPIDTTMLMGIGSNTKLFTSVLCLKMAENNILSLDDSLHHWITNFNYVDSSITIRQLLQHQSGVDDYTTNSSFPNNIMSYPNKVWTPQDILNQIGAPLFQPGTDINYSNTNYILAAMVLEAATNIPYATLVKDSIFAVLDINHTYLEGFEPVIGTIADPWAMGINYSSTPRTAIGTISWAAGCLVSKPSEMVKWYHKLFNTNFLNFQSKTELTNFVSWPTGSYDLGLGLFSFTHNMKEYWGHGGGTIGYSSFFVYDTDCKHSVAVIMNDISANSEPIANALAEKICELTNHSTNIKKINNKEALINVSPNPASDIICVSSENESDIINSISIVDVTGRILYEKNQINTSIFQQFSVCKK